MNGISAPGNRRFFILFYWTLLFSALIRPTSDPDVWTHIRTGGWMLRHGVPSYDLFSFTHAGKPLFDHEYLSQVVLWAVHAAGGMTALSFFSAFMACLTLWVLYHACAGRHALSLYVILLPYVVLLLTGISPRPYLFSHLFTAVFILVLEGTTVGRLRARWLTVLPVLTALWAQFHGGFVIGVGLAGLFWAGDRFGPDASKARSLGLLRTFVLCAAACLFNPYGVKLLPYVLYQGSAHAQLAYVSEWQSPSFHDLTGWMILVPLSLASLAMIFGARKPRPVELALLFGTAAAALYSARHITLFYIINTPFFSRLILERFRNTGLYTELSGERADTGKFGSVLPHILMLGSAVLIGSAWAVMQLSAQPAKTMKEFPVRAVEFMRERGLLQDRLFNDYDWGGYLIGREIPVYIDGRGELYGSHFFNDYMGAQNATRPWSAALAPADLVLIKPSRPLAVVLKERKDWRLLYEDDVAVIYQRIRS